MVLTAIWNTACALDWANRKRLECGIPGGLAVTGFVLDDSGRAPPRMWRPSP
jgi:hypothetical protein